MAHAPWRYAGARIKSRNRVIRSLACRCRKALASRCAASSPSPSSNLATEKCNIYCAVKIVQTLLSIKPKTAFQLRAVFSGKPELPGLVLPGAEHAL